MTKFKVICLGEALIDRIIDQSNLKSKDYLGGAPANVSFALKKLGIHNSFIGCLGDDKAGNQFVDLFNKLRVNYDFLQIKKKFSTRIVKVSRDKYGDRSFSGFENYNSEDFADEMLDKTFLENNITNLKNLFLASSYIVTGTILLTAHKSSESLIFLINLAQDLNLKIVIDVN